MKLESARALADAVLVEGYALYPYRASAPKNQYRWTFGVLAPRAWSQATDIDPWWLEAQLLIAGSPDAVAGELRCFQVERRAGATPWDEGVTCTVPFALADSRVEIPFELAGNLSGRRAVNGRIIVQREPLSVDTPLARLSVRVENLTPWADLAAPRAEAVTAALASTHLVVGVDGAELLSMIDPPAWAREAAASCTSTRTFPVLAGPPGSADIMLCAPFIMSDHPQLAPESAGDLCDATEIDELLVLRTLTMTDAEKREARATDARAAAILDRAEALTPAQLARMHGTARDVKSSEMVPRVPGIGAKVMARPTGRRTDAQDILYFGHVATVRVIRHDVDGSTFVGVTFDDDPAAELHDWYGRYHFYRTDEVEIV
jgi:hypothetical protein